jgi:hypothetical protein
MQMLLEERMMGSVVREERLKATSGLRHVGLTLSSWRGRSGQRYVVSVHSLSDESTILDVTEAVMLGVHRAPDGRPRILAAAAISARECQSQNAAWLASLRSQGANEIHIHRLAENAEEREAIVRDLLPGGRLPERAYEV